MESLKDASGRVQIVLLGLCYAICGVRLRETLLHGRHLLRRRSAGVNGVVLVRSRTTVGVTGLCGLVV
jgi:hypothetical protein